MNYRCGKHPQAMLNKCAPICGFQIHNTGGNPYRMPAILSDSASCLSSWGISATRVRISQLL